MKQPRILLGDDHALILRGIRQLLAERYDIAGAVSNGKDLVEAALKLKPDIIIFDINMPVLNGIDAIRQLRKALQDTKFICLSMHSNAIYLRKAFEAGACAYILKSGVPEELLAAIETVLKGGRWISPVFGTHLIEEVLMRPESSRATADLTDRQRHILQLIAEAKSNKEIADILCVSVKTVEFHRHRILTKLGMHSAAELTRFAVQEGIAGPADRT